MAEMLKPENNIKLTIVTTANKKQKECEFKLWYKKNIWVNEEMLA